MADAREAAEFQGGHFRDGPACEGCGCTWNNPCQGGCGWDTRYRWRGRWVCTACIERGDVAPADKAKARHG